MKAAPDDIERVTEGQEPRVPRSRHNRPFDPDRGEHPGSYNPGAPVWEPWDGLDAYFPDAFADVDIDDDEG